MGSCSHDRDALLLLHVGLSIAWSTITAFVHSVGVEIRRIRRYALLGLGLAVGNGAPACLGGGVLDILGHGELCNANR